MMFCLQVVGRQKGGGVPHRKNAFCAHVPRFETGAVSFLLCNWQKLQDTCKTSSTIFDWGPLYPSVYLDRQNVSHLIKRTGPSLSVFAYCKLSKLDSGKGWERGYIFYTHMYSYHNFLSKTNFGVLVLSVKISPTSLQGVDSWKLCSVHWRRYEYVLLH